MKKMKSKSRGKYIIRGVLIGTLVAVLFTVGLMLLWNWLMPAIFGLGVITFWQALGLLALSKILFGAGHGPHHSWRDREKSKMHREQFEGRFKKAQMMFHDKANNHDADE